LQYEVIKDSTTSQSVLPHYLVKHLTSEIDMINKHNDKNLSIWNNLRLHIDTDYRVNFLAKLDKGRTRYITE